jgi:hypothetical protein
MAEMMTLDNNTFEVQEWQKAKKAEKLITFASFASAFAVCLSLCHVLLPTIYLMITIVLIHLIMRLERYDLKSITSRGYQYHVFYGTTSSTSSLASGSIR